MKTRIAVIITAAIIIVAIFFIYFQPWGDLLPNGQISTGGLSTNDSPELKNVNNSKKLPSPELQQEFRSLQSQYSLGFSKWDFDPIKNEITLYDYPTFNEKVVNDLQGKKIDNYTIRILHDTEFIVTQEEVYKQLWRLHKDPAYQLARIAMVTDAFGDPGGNYAELWVYNSTPENTKLDNTMVQGWTILVYPMAILPSSDGNLSKSG